MLDQKAIKDLKKDDEFQGTLMVKEINSNIDRNGKSYLRFKLADKTGALLGILWDSSLDTHPYKAGDIVEIKAKITSYNQDLQFNFNWIRPLERDDKRSALDNYLRSAPLTEMEMKEIVFSYLERVGQKNKDYKELVIRILNRKPMGNSFFTQPASKEIHHDFLGGLAYHTVRMLKMAGHLTEVYRGLNEALLYSATIIHDAGKLLELTGYQGTEYTACGNLLGHIVILDEWLVEEIVDMGLSPYREDLVMLRHVGLSHHGEKEFGSPVDAMVPEAEALHYIDVMDARLTRFSDELDKLEEGQMTKKTIYGLGGKRVYKEKGDGEDLYD